MRRGGVPGVVYGGAARPMDVLGAPPIVAAITLVLFIVAAFVSHVRPLGALVIGAVGIVIFVAGKIANDKSPFFFSEVWTFIKWRGYRMGHDSSYIIADDAHYGTRDSFLPKR